MRYRYFNKPKNVTVLLVGLFALCFTMPLLALKKIESLRVWAAPESTRVIFDLSQEIQYKLFTLDNPQRVVIDFDDAHFKASFDEMSLIDTGITKIRHSISGKKLRIVLDLESKVDPKSFLLVPTENEGYRLVLDLASPGQRTLAAAVADDLPKKHSDPAIVYASPLPKPPASTIVDLGDLRTREFIVAIDPGHGGDDTGAIGRNHHVKEKDIVFSVSRKLQNLINSQRGMKAYLVRSGDYYIDLRQRMVLAREQGADLFISVHADSFKDPRASGASVFVLSEKGASNEAARWLAERENRSDLVGGVSLEDKGNVLASVLLDLSQTASQSASQELANHLIANLGKVTDLHHKTVQRAGFMVLKSPDIPSVLVELGFISNNRGEEKLLNASHQQSLALALLSGVKAYVGRRPLPVKHPESSTIARKRQPSNPYTKVAVRGK